MFPCEIFWEVQSLIILNAMVHVFFLLQPMAPRPQEGVSYEREPEAERSAALSVGLGEGGTRDAADASGLISNLAEHECRKIEYVNIFTFDNHVCTIEPFTVFVWNSPPFLSTDSQGSGPISLPIGTRASGWHPAQLFTQLSSAMVGDADDSPLPVLCGE